MWFRKTHLMSKKPCELFYKPFFFEPGSCFLPRVNGTSTRKELVLFGILDPQSWWELMSREGVTDSDRMDIPISTVLSFQVTWKKSLFPLN